MSISLLALFMYSVVISTGGGIFIISLLVIKLENDSKCKSEVHTVPQYIICLFLFKKNIPFMCEMEGFTMSRPLMIFGKYFV